MPELAEVEYFRKRWDPGLRRRIRAVAVHGEKRLFRGSDPAELARVLKGATYLDSATRGKQMTLRFSKGGWLGIHLGMSGHLHVEPPDFEPGRHDHLVLFQADRALVLTDPRMFGRVRFHAGKQAPAWWSEGPPGVDSAEFTLAYLREKLARRRAPIKAVVLDQRLFPGVGNWMADEILWRARLNPHLHAADLGAAQTRALHRETRFVCRVAMKTIGVDWSDPPKGWLIHVRWKAGGHCPRDRTPLARETIGGRTTAWCPKCQR
ncbi:MAG TPA: DNA-formamidopyrimidine glycosylase family protein [Chthoniobacteraceae bacterium]|jgi:formamidopyrimidine-DNA glycosylase|nr:DNA-formamidopyrimidine glycosylase family protein [Chthoniobacteraceae bacterium]